MQSAVVLSVIIILTGIPCAFLDDVKGIHTNDEGALRFFIEVVWFGVRSGCQWRLLPESYGNWRAIHRRFKRWADAGIWEHLMHHVATPDTQEVMMDHTILWSHACTLGYGKNTPDQQALGRSINYEPLKIWINNHFF